MSLIYEGTEKSHITMFILMSSQVSISCV